MPTPAPQAAVTVAMSTSSTYPEPVATAFAMAADVGYDAVEVMVMADTASQNPQNLRSLSTQHGLPIVSIHAPTLLISQRVWGSDPRIKLKRSVELADYVDAGLVVVHPPFSWQRSYAAVFADEVRELEDQSGVRIGVENMYPWRGFGRTLRGYAPHWDPRLSDYRNVTLDLSHTAVSGTSPLEMAADLGARLAHVHLADGTGSAHDQHLVPGRGTMPCAQLLHHLVDSGWCGRVVVELSTRHADNQEVRKSALAQALDFARTHLRVAALRSDGPTL